MAILLHITLLVFLMGQVATNPTLRAQNRSLYNHQPQATRCAVIAFSGFENTTITNATYYRELTIGAITIPDHCLFDFPAGFANASVPLCRVEFVVNTTLTSQIKAEAWLPDTWHGRFLAAGNSGLGGCIDYNTLDYGTSFHFATVASNNGHDGNAFDGKPFYHNPEVLNDFANRSIHTMSVIGKEIVQQYYMQPHTKSYYVGCSTGGRQGTYAALHYPADFDGIVAGAPATNWNHLMGWLGMLSTYIGAPNSPTSDSFISEEEWKLVNREVLRQCDGMDGCADGIIAEPDDCEFNPDTLLCFAEHSARGACLRSAQVEALRKIYSLLYAPDGRLLYPRYPPGAESNHYILGGNFSEFASGWWRYVVREDPTYDFIGFGPEDVVAAQDLDPGKISTFSGDLSAFRELGGKLLSYHGTHDEIIAYTNSKNLYDLTLTTLSNTTLPNETTPDDFYRLFIVPGLNHCFGGKGPHRLGQSLGSLPPKNDSDHNVLLAIVDWVERGQAPDALIGTDGEGMEREVCRYPGKKSRWDGKVYVCS